MIGLETLTDKQAECAIKAKEFSQEVIASKKFVAVVLTQGWCPQWVAMRYWLHKLDMDKELQSLELDIYEYVYNESDLFEKFMHFKETVFGNDQVPYVRYYVCGKLIAETNFVSKEIFFGHFIPHKD